MYVLRALQKAHEQTPDHLLMALEVAPQASTETFLTALLNAFSAPRQSPALIAPGGTILILDDYHIITNQEIHTAVAFLLEHLPPSLHLLIASRTYPPFPLTKLRASGYLAELGAEDVRFSAEEWHAFFKVHCLFLSPWTRLPGYRSRQVDGSCRCIGLARPPGCRCFYCFVARRSSCHR